MNKNFWAKVDKTRACWLWTGWTNPSGYGRLKVDGHMVFAHRIAYQEVRGAIPIHLELDHLCRVRRCVNPDHLEPVTHSENIARGNVGAFNRAKSACPKGHAFDDRNTRMYMGRRYCRACSRERNARRRKELLK